MARAHTLDAVRDEGVAIAPEMLDRVFDLFVVKPVDMDDLLSIVRELN